MFSLGPHHPLMTTPTCINFIAVAAILGGGFDERPHVTQSSGSTPSQMQPSATPQTIVDVAFDDLEREFSENSSLFERKFRGRVIRVRVPVLQIDPGEIFFGPEALGLTLRCNPRALSTSELQLLRVGTKVTVTGSIQSTGHKTIVLSSPHIAR